MFYRASRQKQFEGLQWAICGEYQLETKQALEPVCFPRFIANQRRYQLPAELP